MPLARAQRDLTNRTRSTEYRSGSRWRGPPHRRAARLAPYIVAEGAVLLNASMLNHFIRMESNTLLQPEASSPARSLLVCT